MGHQSASRRRRAFTGAEVEAYSRWRRIHSALSRPGAVKWVKARTHRRERREAQREIRRGEA